MTLQQRKTAHKKLLSKGYKRIPNGLLFYQNVAKYTKYQEVRDKVTDHINNSIFIGNDYYSKGDEMSWLL